MILLWLQSVLKLLLTHGNFLRLSSSYQDLLGQFQWGACEKAASSYL